MWTISVKLLSWSLLLPCWFWFFFLVLVCAYVVSRGAPSRLWDPTAWPKALWDLSIVLHYLTGVYRQEGARLSLWVQSGRSRGSGHMLQQGRLWLDVRKKSSPLSGWHRLVQESGRAPSFEMVRAWLVTVPNHQIYLWQIWNWRQTGHALQRWWSGDLLISLAISYTALWLHPLTPCKKPLKEYPCVSCMALVPVCSWNLNKFPENRGATVDSGALGILGFKEMWG